MAKATKRNASEKTFQAFLMSLQGAAEAVAPSTTVPTDGTDTVGVAIDARAKVDSASAVMLQTWGIKYVIPCVGSGADVKGKALAERRKAYRHDEAVRVNRVYPESHPKVKSGDVKAGDIWAYSAAWMSQHLTAIEASVGVDMGSDTPEARAAADAFILAIHGNGGAVKKAKAPRKAATEAESGKMTASLLKSHFNRFGSLKAVIDAIDPAVLDALKEAVA